MQVSIRTAARTDAPTVLQSLVSMLQELESIGDHPVSRDPEQWSRLSVEMRDSIETVEALHLLAEIETPALVPIGWAYARIVDRDPVYKPERVLHISALFVPRPYRQKGIGRTLLEALLEWGRDAECTEVELNVLVNNPARALYEKVGFTASRIKMTREL